MGDATTERGHAGCAPVPRLTGIPCREQRRIALEQRTCVRQETVCPGAHPDLPVKADAGVLPYFSWSIVRYPLALLGPGEPP